MKNENIKILNNKIIKIFFILITILFNLKIKSNLKLNGFSFKAHNKIYNNLKKNNRKFKYTSLKNLIKQLKKDSIFRRPKYLIFIDFYTNPFCNDINAYLLFKYYIKTKKKNAIYVTNSESDLYKTLLKKNKTKNIIPVNSTSNFYEELYPYLLNSKIIVNSYIDLNIQQIVSNVNYLKYLFITHAIGYFKTKIIAPQFDALKEYKRNIIVSSPFEYEFYKKKLKYKDEYMHKAGLPRYDRFNSIKRNKSEKKCILVSFTYRKYSNIIYNNSLYKKNLEKLLNNISLMSFLKRKKIDLIYIQHHYDFFRKRPFNPNDFKYVKYRNQSYLSHYIEQCSLFITDFSTISFDFMFLNKPVLFYLIDLKDKINFEEKEYMKYDKNKELYFENSFSEQEPLIKKIKDYVNHDFKLKSGLKKKYKSMFYYRTNITKRIIHIINKIISKK